MGLFILLKMIHKFAKSVTKKKVSAIAVKNIIPKPVINAVEKDIMQTIVMLQDMSRDIILNK